MLVSGVVEVELARAQKAHHTVEDTELTSSERADLKQTRASTQTDTRTRTITHVRWLGELTKEEFKWFDCHVRQFHCVCVFVHAP
jgi:hypothetical protein